MAISILRSRLLQRAAPYLHINRNSGYIVLLPEIGEEMPDKNPMVREDGLPEFNEFTIEKCASVIGKQALAFEKAVLEIENKASTSLDIFQDVIEPLEEKERPLEFTWGIGKTLYLGNNALMPTKSYMNIHDRAYRARTSKYYSLPIYNMVKEARKDTTSYSEEQYRILDKFLIEGKFNGLELNKFYKERLFYILNEIQAERNNYKRKLDYCNQNFATYIDDPSFVREFPDYLLKAMATDKNDPGKGPWKVSLYSNVYNPFMEYCPDKIMRWNTWQAHERRASAFLGREVDNSIHLEKIRRLRLEHSQLIGFKSYAEMTMKTKIAGGVAEVKNILSAFREKARPAQDSEIEMLQNFAAEHGSTGQFELSDMSFWKRRHFVSSYNFDGERLREYFQLPIVLDGLFKLCSQLFNIRIVERKDASVWHKDVQFYDVFEGSSEQCSGSFYLDPYSRDEEKTSLLDEIGWMTSIRNRSLVTNSEPLAALIFTFQAPDYGKPSLLSFADVTALFHKFGQALRHLLTRARYSDVAGVSNVEWDAVEVCGYFMTHWLYEPEVIKSLSCHYANEKPLPEEILQNISKFRTHLAGFTLCNELYLAHLDLDIHDTEDFWRDLMKKLWPQYLAFKLDKPNGHPCSFSRIFLDSWGSSYYCKLWSRMMAADIYSAFQDAKNNEQELANIGKRYRDTFLALGGGCHPNEVFRRFMGRDVSHKALLQSLELDNETKN